VALATAVVVTANVALVVPAATVTLDATCAEALLEDNATTAPPGGAGAANVTVAVEELPPVSADGFSASDERSIALAVEMKFTPETSLPLTSIFWLVGAKSNPDCVGVIVYEPLVNP
jgi:hypothetical protein